MTMKWQIRWPGIWTGTSLRHLSRSCQESGQGLDRDHRKHSKTLIQDPSGSKTRELSEPATVGGRTMSPKRIPFQTGISK
jgi:hypothetical protein